MKKIFIIFILLSAVLLAKKDFNLTKEIILSQKVKENNNSTIISLKKIVFKKINSFTPDYLNIKPKDNFLDLKLSYDPLKKEFSTKAKVNVILPAFEKVFKKSKKSKSDTNITKDYTFKITPFLTIYKQLPTLVIKPSFTYKVSTRFISFITKSFSFDETVYLYTINREYKEVTTLSFDKIITVKHLMFKTSKTIYSTDTSKIFYNTGFYYYLEKKKNIKVYGLTASGNNKEYPFFQSYKLFFTFRQKLFNKNYLFAELTPYFLASKQWHYEPKFSIISTLNFKF